MPKFRKKPIEIEAKQFIGGRESAEEILRWVNADGFIACWYFNWDTISVKTLEGNMIAKPNDWIIKGIKGEFYPCKPDIFEATYEPIGKE